MRLIAIPVVLLGFAAATPQAWAGVITLGLSNQTVTFTGLGGNVSGEGTNRVDWGACVFDGTQTTCTVSGPFTGLAEGGTYNFVLTYRGNGPSPLTAISQTPGNNFIFFNLTSGSFTTSFTETNGHVVNFYDLTFTFDFSNATCTGVSGCAVGQVGLTPGATITGPITGQFDATPTIRTSLGVITASQYGAFPSIAPSTWVEIYGTNLATTRLQGWSGADFNGDQAPTTLAGTTVTIGGKAAFVQYVTPEQVNAQAPSGIDPTTQPVVVTTEGGTSDPYPITVNPVQPGLLAPTVFNLKNVQYVAALRPDGVTFILPPGTTNAVPTARAKPGETIILYGVGFGPVTPDLPAGQVIRQKNAVQAEVKIFFAGTPATVNFAGLVQGFLGLYQFNVVVPNVAASDTVPLTFTLGGAAGSQTVAIPVGN